MSVMNFKPNFKTFKTAFSIITTEPGHYDQTQGGIWVPGDEIVSEVMGIIVPLTTDDLKFEEGGILTRADIKVFYKEPLEADTEIEYEGRRYRIHHTVSYNHHAGFWECIARRVSADD